MRHVSLRLPPGLLGAQLLDLENEVRRDGVGGDAHGGGKGQVTRIK